MTLPMTKYAREHGVKVLSNTFMTDLLTVGDIVAGSVGFDVFSGDLVVVKGSRGIRMDQVVETLQGVKA